MIELKIDGMSCSSCVSHVEKALCSVAGVDEAAVNLATERARVRGGPHVKAEALISAVNQAGYEASLISSKNAAFFSEAEASLKEAHHWIGAALLSIPLIAPMVLELFHVHFELNGFFQLLLGGLVQFVFGAFFYRGAWKAVKSKVGNMDLLVAVGTSAAFGLSVAKFLQGQSHFYFETSASVITLVLLGKWLERRAKRKTIGVIRALNSLRPEKACVLREEQEVTVALDALLVGDIVLVRPGERIPADGVVQGGESQVDESLITGESAPIKKNAGDKVLGGSINSDGFLQIKVTALGAESFLSRVIALVESAQAGKAPLQRLVDRVSSIFVPIVLGAALVTIFGWGFGRGDWAVALMNGIAVLVIACPCALGLATPTAILVGTGIAARRGILIKDIYALELAHRIKLVAFDKTGTLTMGKPEIKNIKAFKSAVGDALALASALQAGSEHPLAKAILNEAKKQGIEFERARDIKAIPGKGISGTVQGRRYILGNLALLQEYGATLSSVDQVEATRSWLAVEDRESFAAVAEFSFGDAVKPSAARAVEKLKGLKVEVALLTGDNRQTAEAIGRELKIDHIFSGMTPAEKAHLISQLKKNGQIVAMVGDGINDAPALAMADVSIAMASGTDVAMEAAGISLMRSDPELVADAIFISGRTYRKIKQNLFWAFVYNVVGIPLAALGYLTPMLAGAAMAFSSVSVVANALLLRGIKRT